MREKAGFTLPEILVSLVLLALLCTCAVPSLLQSWEQAVMDVTIQQLHRDMRWAQRNAVKNQRDITITFFSNGSTEYYVLRYGGKSEVLRKRILPNGVEIKERQVISILKDRTIRRNGHILLQKGDSKRYVYYYRTGRTRITKKAL